MAEAAIGFAASIAGLAAFGIQIVTTLNTFATSYARAEQQIKDLSADVALTASILESIGKMIREYEDQFHLTVENYIATRDQCERNFRTLWTALKVVKKEESEKTGVKVEYRIGGRMGVWPKMMHAMGGADALRDLVLSINTSKSNLQLLLGSLNFLVLKSLTADAGKRKSAENNATDVVNSAEHVGSVGFIANQPGVTPNDPLEGRNSITPTNYNEEGKREIADISGTTSSKSTSLSNGPDLPHDHLTRPEPTTSAFHGLGNTSQQPSLTPQILSESGDSNETRSLYEGWLLEHVNSRTDGNVAVFCGLKLKIYSEMYLNGEYSSVPFSRNKEMLKNRVEEFERQHGRIGSKTKAQIMQLVTDLDENALDETKSLLDDRNSSATSPYGWKMSAIIDLSKGKFGNRVIWGNRREARKARRWLVVLRGGVLDSPGEEFKDMPERFSDPWEDGYPRRRLRSRGLYRRGTEAKARLEEGSRRGGIAGRQVDVLFEEGAGNDPNRPIYTKMARRHISLEVLNEFKVDYTIDEDPDYVLIKRWVPEYEREFWWTHTRVIRERRQPVPLGVEAKKKQHEETQFEFVRIGRQMKKSSPSPLKNYLPRESSRREDSNTLEFQPLEIVASRSAPPLHVVQDDVAVEDDPPLSQEEAEILMDEFLTTFTSDDGNQSNHRAT